MKARLLILCSAVMLTLTTHGGIISYSTFANSGYIPDGNAAGSYGTATASGYLPSISDVSVSLNISGGYNGDLYAYLSYGGVLVPLLNRVGVGSTHAGSSAFGYGDAGLNITLTSSGNDIHWYRDSVNPGGGQLTTGTWRPDGRAIGPQATPSSFDSSSGRLNFDSYTSMNPNGTWTLFIGDLSSGAQSQLVSWSLDLTAVVPEPVNVALGIFGGVFLVVILVRSRLVRDRVRRATSRLHHP
jgi:hypothetical protein